MSAEQLTAVRPAHRFDENALAAYLADRLTGFRGPLTVRQFEGGQSNPTFLLDTPRQRYVLRKKPPGPLLPSAHLIEREYRLFRALATTAVPVPKTYLLCEDDGIIGTAFFVMDYVAGRLLRDPALPEITDAAAKRAVYDAVIATLAALHAVDLEHPEVGLSDFGKQGGYIARQIRRWSQQYQATATETIAAMDKLIDWLPANLPAADNDATTLVHGDYRIDNLLFHPSEPRVLAVLDWELATLGHPLSDLAYTCMYYHVALPDGYLGDVAGRHGIPSEAELVAAYCRHSGRAGEQIPDWPFYLAFSLFRYAAIVQGVHYRGLQGNASSAQASRYGELAKTAAAKAWQLVS